MRRVATADDLYFVTLTTIGWVDVFTRPLYKQYIIENLAYCQKHKGLTIYSYVLMTNHLHIIGDVNKGSMSDWLRDFKSFTSKGLYKLITENEHESRKEWMIELFKDAGKENEANSDFQLWQNGSHPVVLYGQQPHIIQQKINYIHENPVRAGIVAEAHMYLYSSAHEQNPLRVAGVVL